MAVELKVPEVGESVTEVIIGTWYKAEGDRVEKDENVAEIETDKATVELPAPTGGILSEILKGEGEEAAVGEVIARIEEGAEPEEETEPEEAEAEETEGDEADESPKGEETEDGESEASESPEESARPVMPSARRLLEEHGLKAAEVEATGPGGRLLKEDVKRHLEQADEETAPASKTEKEPTGEREEERVEMSPIRRRIAERLVDAKRQAALLTTFNEIDMSAVIEAREKHRDRFREIHGVKLGYMSFFVKATVEALKEFPKLNAIIDGNEIVYRNYYDIGVAISTDRGLLVPIVRDVHRAGFWEIESRIAELASRARSGELKLHELQGGTFSITNGGVFGSLLSTPIVNPPQSGILGMHAIQDRPVAREGEIVVRPMMYVALTYDHRIVDGREAVSCLRRIKEMLEDPIRMLLEV